MNKSSETDLILFFKSLVHGLQPAACKKNIQLEFTSTENIIMLNFYGHELHAGFTRLISSIIDYMPENNTIYLIAEVVDKAGIKDVSVKIRNTGINLKMLTGITNNSSLPVSLLSSGPDETTYEVCYSLKHAAEVQTVTNGSLFNYISLVKGIQTHFAKLSNPVARLSESKPKEAAFLININQCILDNISDERFDANALSTAMAMSRAQLLRRLKALTGNSPGFYIKTMRLEKAKELLEKSDVSISEAAYKTGFGTPSNFTKVFAEKYGITPSQFRRINPNATNK
jgi:AraC-like DNA-binding protein